MTDLNRVMIIGRLTREAELKYTSGGMAIANGSIAVNRRTKRAGEWVDEVNYFDFVIFGKQAEGLKQYLTKGKQVALDGYLKQDRWQDQDGQNRSKVYINVENLQFVGGKSEGNPNAPKFSGNTAADSSGYESNGYTEDDAGEYSIY